MDTFEERLEKFYRSNGRPTICIKHLENQSILGFNSYFGGAPFIPDGFEWPVNPISGKPQVFIGQINFEELWDQLPEYQSNLPKFGLLQFFYRSQEDLATNGFYGEDQEDINFFWYPLKTSDLQIQANPSAASEQFSTPIEPKKIAFYLEHREGSGDMLASSRLFSDEEISQWWLNRPPFHQLQGDYYPLQYNPAEIVDGNDQFSSGWQFWKKKDPKATTDWELLWQIDSDDALGYQWGNGGMIYILVNKQDLAHGDLSNLIFNLQTT